MEYAITLSVIMFAVLLRMVYNHFVSDNSDCNQGRKYKWNIYLLSFQLERLSMSTKKHIRTNLTHKHSVKFNTPKTFKDKKNDYQRKEKYPSKRWDISIIYVNFSWMGCNSNDTRRSVFNLFKIWSLEHLCS